MKFRILESNKDKKGAALERIVGIILGEMGYSITKNEISAGGNELDVVAQKQDDYNNQPNLIICECKAHEKPIDTNDWLKFLGKYYKEKRKTNNVRGLMIALSDANGNVKGDIRESNYDGEVELLTSSSLMEYIETTFHLGSRESVNNTITTWSRYTITDCDFAYYHDEIYWIIELTDAKFTILDKNACFPNQDIISGIIGTLVQTTTFTREQYIDIRRDKVVALKRAAIETVALWSLMSGMKSVQEIAAAVVEGSGNSIHPEDYEIINCFKDSEFIKISDGILEYKSIETINKVSLYKKILSVGVPTKLYNNFYFENIDEDLLNMILAMYPLIELSEEERRTVLFLLKHSPSALRNALSGNPMYSPRINVENANISALKESVKSTFIQSLANCLEVDADSDIAMFLFDKLEIRDLHKQTLYSVVTKNGTTIKIPVSKRLYYIPFNDVEGGAVIQASSDFIGQYDSKTGYMIGAKRTGQAKKTLFGIVKHKTGESGEEYISLYN